MNIALLSAIVLLSCTVQLAFAGDTTSLFNKINNFPNKFLRKVNNKTSELDQRLDRQTVKYLQKLARSEAKLKKGLYQYDSTAAKNLFANNPEQQYALLGQKIKTDSGAEGKIMNGEYLANVDSLQGSLSFLGKHPQLLSNSKNVPADIQNSLNQLQQLQSKMQDADQIKEFVRRRKEQIKQYLSQYTHLPAGITKAYSDYTKNMFYYSQQIHEYKEILNDPDKMMKTVFMLLNRLPAFAAFMKDNSFLSGLFNVPDNYGSPGSLVGLQTRDQLSSIIQGQISSGGSNAMSVFSQNLQSAQQQLQQLKDKIASMGSGGENLDNPDFRPNNQKSKSLLGRLEYGTNMQTTHSAYYYPTTDVGLSIGYKINTKSTIGIGASYEIGLGSDIRHVNISSRGAGLRSFFDLQMKKSFYASGGFEYNYRQPVAFQTGILSNWQQSGLIGLSKIVSMNTKIFKKTKLQLLWDFLSYQQIPKTQPINFRIGYAF